MKFEDKYGNLSSQFPAEVDFFRLAIQGNLRELAMMGRRYSRHLKSHFNTKGVVHILFAIASENPYNLFIYP